MASEFAGKRALVTGAARGIGKAIAKKLTSCGAKVVALDVLSDLLEQLKNEIPGVETVCVDLTDWEATKKAVMNSGPFDLLVNNAGIFSPSPIGEIEEEALDRMWAVNVKAPVNISQIVANSLKERGLGGAIVTISNLASHFICPLTGPYAATKSAVFSISKTMAVELAPYKIRCNTVHPGLVKTEMGRNITVDPQKTNEFLQRVPLGEICDPEDIAEGVAFLLSEKHAGKITGHPLFIDGASSIS